MKKKVLIVSVLTIVLCASLIIGATLALFSSRSDVNIAVSSGKVEISAAIDEKVSLYSPTAISNDGTVTDATNAATDTNFKTGGTAAVQNGQLAITNIAPGDKVTFKIDITNSSNVNYQQRLTFSLAEGSETLYNQLLIGVGTTEGEYTYYGSSTKWMERDAATTSDALFLSVELPAYAGNSAQAKSCTVRFTLEAAQKNANVTDESDPVHTVDSTADLTSLMSGGTVKDIDKIILGGSASNWVNAEVSLSFNDAKTLYISGYKVGTMTITAAQGTVYVFNDAGSITGAKVAEDSLHVYGRVDTLTVNSGRAVVEEGAEVGTVSAIPSADSEATVEFAENVIVKKLVVDTSATNSSTNLTIAENVVIPSFKVDGSGNVTLENNGTIVDTEVTGETKFESTVTTIEALQTAVALGGNITLGADVVGNIVIEAGKTVTLDLNNYSITSPELGDDSVHAVSNYGTLTIKNGTIVNESEKGTDFGPNAAIRSFGTLTVENCEIRNEAGTSGSYCVGIKGGSATITDCTVYGARGGLGVEGDGAVNVSGCTFTSAYYYPLYIYGNGQSTFEDSTFIKVPELESQGGTGGNALIYNDINPDEYGDTATAVFTNCTFESTREGGSNLEIAAMGDSLPNYRGMTFNGCTFTNVNVVWDGKMADTSWYNESETSFTLNTAMQLAGLAQLVNNGNDFSGKTITLSADINLNSQEWTPIGTAIRSGSAFTGNTFSGTFDGNGHTISGLKITSSPGNEDFGIGLFNSAKGATIKNFTLENVEINVKGDAVAAAVGLVSDGATISGINTSGTIEGTDGVGGIVGRMLISGTIENCTNAAAISASGKAGGIVGAAYYTQQDYVMTISSCENSGAVTSTSGYIGGIVGLNAGNISDCTNSGAVTGSGTSIGGIVGEQQSYGKVTDNMNTAAVKNNSSDAFGTGGIVGWVRYNGADSDYDLKAMIEVTGNTNSGSVTGGDSSGGIVGHIYNVGVVRENINKAELISSSNFAAGIVGSLQYADGNTYTEEQCDIEVTYNVSTTPVDSISGDYTDQYAYNNRQTQGDFVVKNNFATEDELKGMVIHAADAASFKEALGSVKEGGLILLEKDIVLARVSGATHADGTSETYIVTDNVTIDLQGHTVTVWPLSGDPYGSVFGLAGDGITLRNGTVTMFNTSNTAYPVYVTSNAQNVTIEDVTIIGGVQVLGNSTATLRDVDITATTFYCVYLEGGEGSTCSVTIESGTFTRHNSYPHIYTTRSSNTVIVNGGSYDGSTQPACGGNGKVTINVPSEGASD